MANPLSRRFLIHVRWLSFRATLWVSFVGGLLSLLLGSLVFLDTRYYGLLPGPFCCTFDGNRFEHIGDGILVATLIGGLAVIPLVAQFVAHDTTTELFQLMQLTTISNAKIVNGYFFGMLVRLRFLLMLMIILMPLAFLFVLRSEIEIRAYEFELCLDPPANQSCMNSIYSELTDLPGHFTLLRIGYAAELWGVVLAGISLGVAIGLAIRRRVAAVLFSFVAIICVLYFVLHYLDSVDANLVNPLWPYGVTIFVLILARNWARIRPTSR